MRRTTLALTVTVTLALGVVGVARRTRAAEPTPPDAIVELGRRLFHERAATSRGRVSCADCHDPDHAYSDPRVRSHDGVSLTRRHSQTLLDIGESRLHWDGEFTSLEDLLVAQVASAAGAAIRSSARLSANYRGPAGKRSAHRGPSRYSDSLKRATAPTLDAGGAFWLELSGRYVPGFTAAFGEPDITIDRAVQALQAYVLTIRSGESPFDRFVAGDATAVSERARRGYELFRGRAKCARCHPVDQGRAITDGRMHRMGSLVHDKSQADAGAGAFTGRPGDLGKFKTPNLRDVAVRPPYMHDGSIATLEGVVARYLDRPLGSEVPLLQLNLQERSDLVAFLRSLTADLEPNVARVVPTRTTRLRIVDLDGGPIPELALNVVPTGGRLGPRHRPPREVRARTDAEGYATVELPTSTHFEVRAAGVELGSSRPLPDWSDEVELIATPLDRVSLRVRWMLRTPRPELVRCILLNVRGREDFERTEIVLVHVRDLGPNEALYSASERGDNGWVRLSFERADAPLTFLTPIDLRGGASDPIVVVRDRDERLTISSY